eukprot:2048751-Rhodomonas_salina.2
MTPWPGEHSCRKSSPGLHVVVCRVLVILGRCEPVSFAAQAETETAAASTAPARARRVCVCHHKVSPRSACSCRHVPHELSRRTPALETARARLSCDRGTPSNCMPGRSLGR